MGQVWADSGSKHATQMELSGSKRELFTMQLNWAELDIETDKHDVRKMSPCGDTSALYFCISDCNITIKSLQSYYQLSAQHQLTKQLFLHIMRSYSQTLQYLA